MWGKESGGVRIKTCCLASISSGERSSSKGAPLSGTKTYESSASLIAYQRKSKNIKKGFLKKKKKNKKKKKKKQPKMKRTKKKKKSQK